MELKHGEMCFNPKFFLPTNAKIKLVVFEVAFLKFELELKSLNAIFKFVWNLLE